MDTRCFRPASARHLLLALLLLLLMACSVTAGAAADSAKGDAPVTKTVSNDAPLAGWEAWSPRTEIAPRTDNDNRGGRSGGPALRIASGGNPAAYGGWRKRIETVTPGKTYRFTAWYRTRDVPQKQLSVAARLDWLTEKGQRARPPDYAAEAAQQGEWTRVEYVAVAPENARSVLIELSLAWAASGTVWWDDVTLTEVAPAPGRTGRVATVYLRPRGTGTPERAVAAFQKVVEDAADAGQRFDLVCLSEAITMQGTGKTYADVAEPVPGPTLKTLGELARRLRAYVVAGIIERDGATLYNTALLIGRDGSLVGKYRKTHLPREEVEGGLTPGDSYPVFDTDFGRLGLLICWDVQFPEPARALALQGAEMIALPIAGGSDILTRARAIENHLFLVSSSYDMRSFVVDPTGGVLAEATTDRPFALAEINLDRPILQPWLGDMKPRTWKERRPDLPVEPAKAP